MIVANTNLSYLQRSDLGIEKNPRTELALGQDKEHSRLSTLIPKNSEHKQGHKWKIPHLISYDRSELSHG